MRINTIGTPLVNVPEQSLEVTASRAARPVEQRSPGAGQMPARAPAGARPVPAQAPAPAVGESERRRESRRGEERRKRQVPVLIDTRVGDRRAKRRRAADEAPPSIDLKA